MLPMLRRMRCKYSSPTYMLLRCTFGFPCFRSKRTFAATLPRIARVHSLVHRRRIGLLRSRRTRCTFPSTFGFQHILGQLCTLAFPHHTLHFHLHFRRRRIVNLNRFPMRCMFHCTLGFLNILAWSCTFASSWEGRTLLPRLLVRLRTRVPKKWIPQSVTQMHRWERPQMLVPLSWERVGLPRFLPTRCRRRERLFHYSTPHNVRGPQSLHSWGGHFPRGM